MTQLRTIPRIFMKIQQCNLEIIMIKGDHNHQNELSKRKRLSLHLEFSGMERPQKSKKISLEQRNVNKSKRIASNWNNNIGDII